MTRTKETPDPMTAAQLKAPEVVRATMLPDDPALPGQLVSVDPTQVRRPWRSTVRTIFQALVALATLLPLMLTDVYDGSGDYPAAVIQVLVVCGIVTRVMANPAVEEFLRRFLPFLAAAPSTDESGEGGASSWLWCLGVALAAVVLYLIFNVGGHL